MGMNTLLLHIGKQKTGTTAIQKFLCVNADVIEEYGWCYPTDKVFMKENPWYNGMGFYGKGYRIDTESLRWKQLWECLHEYLEKKNVILSAENISIINTHELLRKVKQEYDNVKVIVYLRRQDVFVESLWNQMVKSQNGCYTGSVQECWEEFFGEGEFRREKLYYYNELEAIAAIIGKENLIVRVYEKQQLEGERKDAISDFFSAIGLTVDWKKFKGDREANLRISGNELMIKRVMNHTLKRECGKRYKTEIMESFMDMGKPGGQRSAVTESHMTKEERIAILEEFKEQNELVAREYLHREDGKLFYDMNVDIPQYESSMTPFEEDMIRVFTTLLCEQNKKLEKLEILIKKGTRKLAFFGAGMIGKKMLEKGVLPVELFIDNDVAKAGMLLGTLEIVRADCIEDWSKYFVVITCVQTEDIEEQLQQYGLKKGEDYILASDYFVF